MQTPSLSTDLDVFQLTNVTFCNRTLELNLLNYQNFQENVEAVLEILKNSLKVEKSPEITMIGTV